MSIHVSWQIFHFVKTYFYIINEHSSEILFTDTDMLCCGTGLRPTVKHCQNCMASAVCVNSRWLCKSLILFQTREKKNGKKKIQPTNQNQNHTKPKWWLLLFFFNPCVLFIGFSYLFAVIWLYAKDVIIINFSGLSCSKTLALRIVRHMVNYEPWWGPPPGVCLWNECGTSFSSAL